MDEGIQHAKWAPVAAFAVGFLVARILEGPLVGILDIGGSIMTGVGIGIPAVLLSVVSTNSLMKNPLFGLVLGAGSGLAIGVLIILVRQFAKKAIHLDLGTSIMMGAGNQAGAFLGPLVIVAAAMFNTITGLGAAIGSIVFINWKKPILGGAILGAMLFGIIPVMF